MGKDEQVQYWIKTAEQDVDELRALNYWNLEGRYPDYLNKIKGISKNLCFLHLNLFPSPKEKG